jgi:hypothetical protein
VSGVPALALLVALAWSWPAATQESGCDRATAMRCWYWVGSTGEAPGRIAFIASHVGDPGGHGPRKIQFVQVIEPAQHREAYVVMDMDVDCGQASFRVGRTRAGLRDGRVVEKPVENDGWQDFADSRYGEASARQFACGAEADADKVAIFLWSAYRVPDTVGFFREVYWTGPDAPR